MILVKKHSLIIIRNEMGLDTIFVPSEMTSRML